MADAVAAGPAVPCRDRFAALRFGPRLLEMINVAIKGAVVQ